MDVWQTTFIIILLYYYYLLQVKEKTLQARVKSVFVLHAKAAGGVAPKPTPVLLLHGAKFSTQTWDNTGTISTLVQHGYDVYVALSY